jgi:response regulator NasT
LKILVVGENPEQRAIVQSGLALAGWSNVSAFPVPERITDLVQPSSPDVLVLVLAKPNAQILGQAYQISKSAPLPIVLFIKECNNASISAAINGGIAAIVVDGLAKERVGTILELAIARFQSMEKLKAELSAAKGALKDRKVIDRAKGALMKANGLDEGAAYALLRETAMRQSRKISDVAESLLNSLDLLQPAGREP